MKKKALIVASVYDFFDFLVNDITILQSMGYEVHCASNMRVDDWLMDKGRLDIYHIVKHQIDFGRTPLKMSNLIAYKQLKKLIKIEQFRIIHCHTPVAAAICRLAAREARKGGTKVFYTCHGFHFHKYSSKKNWLLYYPIEKLLASLTDAIITINKEDFRVVSKFNVKNKEYIPGVGVDITKFKCEKDFDVQAIRSLYNIPRNAFVIISTGELSERKNQEVIIKAIGKLKEKRIFYLICGEGNKHKKYEKLAKTLGIESQIIMLGHVSYERIVDICKASDIGAFPSKIEGLGLSGIEILAAGKPLVASNVHGIVDYAVNGFNSFTCRPNDVHAFAEAIKKLYKNKKIYDYLAKNATSSVKKFSREESYKKLYNIYNKIL